MHFADLSPCDYFRPLDTSGRIQLLSVGWLEPGFDFTRGPLDVALARELGRVFRMYGRGFFAGGHYCGFCFEAAGGVAGLPGSLGGIPQGFTNLFLAIPNDNRYLVLPQLITHYMRVHSYQPPSQLREAVAWRPPVDVFRVAV